MYMRGVTAIEPEWLPDFCPLDCNLSKPLSDREPFYDQEKGQIMTFRCFEFTIFISKNYLHILISCDHVFFRKNFCCRDLFLISLF